MIRLFFIWLRYSYSVSRIKRKPLKETKRVSSEQNGDYVQLNQYKLQVTMFSSISTSFRWLFYSKSSFLNLTDDVECYIWLLSNRWFYCFWCISVAIATIVAFAYFNKELRLYVAVYPVLYICEKKMKEQAYIYLCALYNPTYEHGRKKRY